MYFLNSFTAIFFYAPYILFRIINADMIHLKGAVKSAESEQDTKNIIDMYFLNSFTAIFFYAPYILFRIINADMIHLKGAVKSAESEQDTKNIIDIVGLVTN